MLLDALKGENRGSRPPVWLMRQAGRYQPSYRALRKKHSIMTLFRTPELIAQVTKLPVDELGVDGAILFSDILVLLDMFGIEWTIEPGVGPVIGTLPEKLPWRPAEEAVPFVFEAIGSLKEELTIPLIGFCGAPFTLASYLIEGRGSKTLAKTRALAYRDPERMHEMLDTLADAAIDLLRAQVRAGVDAVQIFDSWAHWLGPEEFEAFSQRYLRKIREAITDVPVICFCRGTLPNVPGAAIGVDWQNNLVAVRKKHPGVALQGNFDPALLYAPPEVIRMRVTEQLRQMGPDPAYVANLGHGILPDTPYENVRTFVDTVKEWQW